MLGPLKSLYINLHGFIRIELIFILVVYKDKIKRIKNIKIFEFDLII